MTPTATATIGSDIRFEQTKVTRPKRSEVVKAIRDEARSNRYSCNRRHSDGLLNMIVRAAAAIRASGYEVYHLNDYDLEYHHWLLDAVMPDDITIPRPGSAHELIQRYVLRGNELALVHTRDGADRCVVAVAIDSV